MPTGNEPYGVRTQGPATQRSLLPFRSGASPKKREGSCEVLKKPLLHPKFFSPAEQETLLKPQRIPNTSGVFPCRDLSPAPSGNASYCVCFWSLPERLFFGHSSRASSTLMVFRSNELVLHAQEAAETPAKQSCESLLSFSE